MTHTPKTFNAYVDGFNLYRGLLKDRPSLRWLDLRTFCASRWPDHELQKVYFFTSRAKERFPGDAAPRRQHAYIRALESTGVEVVYGKFAKNIDWLRLNGELHREFLDPNLEDPDGFIQEQVDRAADFAAPDMIKANVWRFGEKGTDVNLASQLLFDAWTEGLEAALVVTGDSDLVKPIHMLTSSLIEVKTLVPSITKPALMLRTASTYTETIHPSWLKACQLPEKILLRGSVLTKPEKWV